VHAAVWFYSVDITIYAKEYASNGGSLIFTAMDQTQSATLIVLCGYCHTMATTIITASGHPGTPIGILDTSQM
jgi:hypothetical protein